MYNTSQSDINRQSPERREGLWHVVALSDVNSAQHYTPNTYSPCFSNMLLVWIRAFTLMEIPHYFPFCINQQAFIWHKLSSWNSVMSCEVALDITLLQMFNGVHSRCLSIGVDIAVWRDEDGRLEPFSSIFADMSIAPVDYNTGFSSLNHLRIDPCLNFPHGAFQGVESWTLRTVASIAKPAVRHITVCAISKLNS